MRNHPELYTDTSVAAHPTTLLTVDPTGWLLSSHLALSPGTSPQPPDFAALSAHAIMPSSRTHNGRTVPFLDCTLQ
eukprot:13987071-Heterocapsa_arctica.AAC.1